MANVGGKEGRELPCIITASYQDFWQKKNLGPQNADFCVPHTTTPYSLTNPQKQQQQKRLNTSGLWNLSLFSHSHAFACAMISQPTIACGLNLLAVNKVLLPHRHLMAHKASDPTWPPNKNTCRPPAWLAPFFQAQLNYSFQPSALTLPGQLP